MVVETSGEVGLHQLIEELDVFRQGGGELVRGAVPVGRGDGADKLPVVQGVVDLRPGERFQMCVLNALPEAEEFGHRLDQRHGLGAEYDRELPDGLLRPAVKLHLVLDGGTVLVLQRAFERHRQAVRREEGHQLPRGLHQRVDRGEHVVDPPLRRGIIDVLGEDLIDQRRAVRARAVGQTVNLAHDLVVEH